MADVSDSIFSTICISIFLIPEIKPSLIQRSNVVDNLAILSFNKYNFCFLIAIGVFISDDLNFLLVVVAVVIELVGVIIRSCILLSLLLPYSLVSSSKWLNSNSNSSSSRDTMLCDITVTNSRILPNII